MRKEPPLPLIVVAVALGLLIAWVDSRPTWDDAGITAAALFLTAALCGALRPSFAWLSALAVGIWIPLWGILGRHDYGSLLVLLISFLGAYAGVVVRLALASLTKREDER